MFDHAMDVRAVTLVMRGARAYGYFGLNSVALLVESGSPVMLVSGVTNKAGELCAVSTGGSIQLAPCLDVLAGGKGDDVFQFGEDGLLHSLAGGCVVSSDGALRIGSCETASQADDGRAMFDLTNSGQIRIGVGDLCVVASGHVLATATCVEASKSSSAADKFFAFNYLACCRPTCAASSAGSR